MVSVLTVMTGTQSISKGLAKMLKPGSVLFNTAVEKIQQVDGGCVVTSNGGSQYRCRKVVVSVPTPLYRHITFNPPLPQEKREYAESTLLGDYSKVTLVYTSPWWRDIGLSGSFVDLGGPLLFSRDTSVDQDGQYSITCFVVGDDSRRWSQLQPKARRDEIVNSLAEMVGPEGREKLFAYEDYRDTVWKEERWSEGAPCPAPKAGGWNGLALRAPFDNIHFVGTETAFEWKGYMEGAVCSGRRGAKEVVDDLH